MRLQLLLTALIFTLTLSLYIQTCGYTFVVYDDDLYVAQSEVANGLSVPTIKWAVTNGGHATGNWHPLTMLSLMTDVSLWRMLNGTASESDYRLGLAGWMHAHNALLHAINAVLLFYFLLMLGRATFSERAAEDGSARSESVALPLYIAAFIGAAFWALHPLRVESVAWVSSRKDVLCVFWYLAGHLAYLKYAFQNSKKNEMAFLLALLCFSLAFASKPTAVVFPCTLLLMEYLLKGRIHIERLPIFAGLTVFFSVLVILAQRQAMEGMSIPLLTRMLNAIASVGDYLGATVWPSELAVFYPYEDPVSLDRLIPGLIICGLLGVFVVVPFMRRLWRDRCNKAEIKKVKASFCISNDRHPLCSLGLLWFLGCLIPVCGIIHVGFAPHADRYTYLAGIGLSLFVSYWLVFLGIKIRNLKTKIFYYSMFSILIFALVVQTNKQTRYWQNSLTLFERAVAVTDENYVANANLGVTYSMQGDFYKAFFYERLSVAQYGRLDVVPRIESALFALFKKEGRDVQSLLDVTNVEIKDSERLVAEKRYAQALIAYSRGLSSTEMFIQQSIQACSTDGYSYELYSKILASQGRDEEALQMLRKAQSLLPRRIAIKEALKKMKKETINQRS